MSKLTKKSKIIRAIIIAAFLFVCFVAVTSCQEEDKTTTLDKEGSISVVVSTKHLNDSFDVMSVTTETFKKNKSVSVKVTYDTIPTLGKFKTEAEDSLGNVKEVTIPKEYEFYVTLK